MEFIIPEEYKNNSGIYLITNTVNARVYVGSAKNLWYRYYRHLWDLKKGTHCNDRLINFCAKHGTDKLVFSVLELCPIDAMVEREQHWLNHYNSYKTGFNMVPNAGNTLGFKMPAEIVEKIADQIRGRKQPKEVVERRIATIKERYKHTPKASPIKIAQFDEGGNISRVFRSFRECGDYFGVNRGTVKRWFFYSPRMVEERNLKIIEGAGTIQNNDMKVRVCPTCGKEFSTLSNTQRFCGHSCRRSEGETKVRLQENIKRNVTKRTADSFKRIGAARTKHQYKIQLMDGSGKLIKVYDSPFDCSTDFLENFMGIPYMENKKLHLRFRKRFCRVFTQDKHIEGYIFRMAP